MQSESPVYTIEEIAQFTSGTIFGPSDVEIHGAAEVTSASSGDITYAVNEQYIQKLFDGKASAAIVPKGAKEKHDFSMTIIEAENPYWSFAQVLRLFAPKVPLPEKNIHDSASVSSDVSLGSDVVIGANVVIDSGVKIGKGSYIGAGTHIGASCTIGNDCKIHSNVSIREFCSLGNRVIIQSGSVIGSDGYGYVQHKGAYHKIPQIGIVEIQDDVEIGSLVCIDRATIGKTIIGKGTKMDNLIQIGHNVELGEHCAIVSQVGISGSTKVGSNCRFAGQSATSGHLSIGKESTIAARGVVVKDLPPKSFVSGFPAKPHGEERKIIASLPRLPTMVKRLSKLERRVQELEQSNVRDGDV